MKLNEHVRIVAKTCDLVPYEPTHVEKYHDWMQDEELRRLTCSDRLSIEEEYEMQKAWREDEDKLTFIILDKDESKSEIDRMVGDVNLFIGEEESEVEIMIAEPSARKKGIAKEAVSLIISYAIKNLNLRKFQAKITDDNVASISLFEQKLGFERVSHSAVFQQCTTELPEKSLQFFETFLAEHAEIKSYP